MNKLNEIEIHVKDKRVNTVILNGVELNFVREVTVHYTPDSTTDVTLVLSAYDSDVKVVVEDENTSV